MKDCNDRYGLWQRRMIRCRRKTSVAAVSDVWHCLRARWKMVAMVVVGSPLGGVERAAARAFTRSETRRE